jgi:hypothetical protein
MGAGFEKPVRQVNLRRSRIPVRNNQPRRTQDRFGSGGGAGLELMGAIETHDEDNMNRIRESVNLPGFVLYRMMRLLNKPASRRLE